MIPAAQIRQLIDELFEIAPWWREWPQDIDEGALVQYETEHGISLPEQYRTVLIEIGDHAPLPTSPAGALLPLADARELTTLRDVRGPLASPFPHSGAVPLSIAWNAEADEFLDPHWLRGCLPLADEGCAQSVVLVVSGPERGRVWRVSPSAAPELHPTGQDFATWYLAQLERGLAPARARARSMGQLERQFAEAPDDLDALAQLGESLLMTDRARARAQLDAAWRDNSPTTASLHYLRAVAQLDLLDDRRDRFEALVDSRDPQIRCYAAVAAIRAQDTQRGLELLEDRDTTIPIPAKLRPLVLGHHALALWRADRPHQALDLLAKAPPVRERSELAIEILTALGEHEQAQRRRVRLRPPGRQKPRPPQLLDALPLPLRAT